MQERDLKEKLWSALESLLNVKHEINFIGGEIYSHTISSIDFLIEELTREYEKL